MSAMKQILFLFAGALTLIGADLNPEARQVMAAMESFKKAMIGRDGPTLDRLLTNDLMYTHSAGKVETKAEFMQAITSGKSITEKLEFTDPVVRVYGNTAIVRGRVDLWHSPTNIVHMDVLHVWVKSQGEWRMVARQATKLAP